MDLGIDLGTSSVKLLLVDDAARAVDEQSAPLDVARPYPGWSEQDPEDWWRATDTAALALRARRPAEMARVRAIGLAGQMHGATLLDARDRVLRPAILWNDGRSAPQCRELERREPRTRAVTGNKAMPGFTAPKLLWVAEREPDVFRQVARVLLPKDYLRLRLSGDAASDPSDAAGTLWLDVAARAWSPAMLAATNLDERAMPRLHEGSEPTGTIRDAVADAWGVPRGAIVAAGAGDNAAGAVGAGVIRPGDAFLSLGTSGVYFVAGDRFAPNPERAVHAFCHCLPRTWHQMSVLLSAASCLTWIAHATGAANEAALLDEIARADDRDPGVLFLPYLSGERTPHDDANARGVLVGMTQATTRADLGRAVLEGVALAFVDAQDALLAAGTTIGRMSVIGGGARSALWGRILASALDRELDYHAGAEHGPSFGAARLARLAATGEDPRDVCTPPPVAHTIAPDPALRARYAARIEPFRRLYRDLRDGFAALASPVSGEE
ncbi:MAG: xylulokinase [Deltaproteobacteria bacterium]|nr:xylulokinase [Deltaproteobacteria bacterium]